MMRVFAIGTGRTGSTTFARSCGHMTNYSVGCETIIHLRPEERVRIPSHHIEVDNRLVWCLWALDRLIIEEPRPEVHVVWLKRDPAACVRSLAGRMNTEAYHRLIRPGAQDPKVFRGSEYAEALASDYHDAVHHVIECWSWKDPCKMSVIDLESYETDLRAFWNAIGATGDFPAALREYGIKHNASG